MFFLYRKEKRKEWSLRGGLRGGRVSEGAVGLVEPTWLVGPPPLRGSFFLENGALRDTREKILMWGPKT